MVKGKAVPISYSLPIIVKLVNLSPQLDKTKNPLAIMVSGFFVYIVRTYAIL